MTLVATAYREDWYALSELFCACDNAAQSEGAMLQLGGGFVTVGVLVMVEFANVVVDATGVSVPIIRGCPSQSVEMVAVQWVIVRMYVVTELEEVSAKVEFCQSNDSALH